ncbi:hypothetical protein [Clostridium botulinum]|uniref:hypothetical protein n=1 Tax=Clostridium botulinum TaxID=1491 RepID=UPI001969D89F|nr:hypothetical protein [Clostridium botulinum]MBN3386849.1 hypothetical protein [Clostridium botulinum]
MENLMIPKSFYMNFFWNIGEFIIVIFVLEVLVRYFSKVKVKFLKLLLIVCKIFFYGILLFFTCFFNFKSGTISLIFPETITFTQLIMAPITAFEVLSNILDLFDLSNYY